MPIDQIRCLREVDQLVCSRNDAVIAIDCLSFEYETISVKSAEKILRTEFGLDIAEKEDSGRWLQHMFDDRVGV